MAMKYSFVLNNQKINKLINFSYFRGNIETSGNALWLASRAFGMEQDELSSYKIFNIRYSQFVKLDADYRFYNFFNKHSSVVYRLAAGIAFPYGNIEIMPFDKSFYAGGANGIRAWKLYDLGPGAYSDTNVVKFYKTGDIQLEANMEYRFDIYKYLKGALFIDAGNIWLRKKNEQFPNAEFKLNEFYKQIALGGGIGARLDFSFFIIRLDAGIPLRDPSRVPELRWVYDEMKLTKLNFNLGIGYPF
ncbi:MAG: Outer membrane protein assembly factor BamA [Bacteroidetes bacterium ADurb.Bin408]|nr:MAG: Outer membrane protein assembly factor BamA [Bacteroidetes bacterium ADurb.Bin408]